MASLNRVQLIGNLGRDPELRYTKTQVPYAKFSLATTEEFTSGGEKQKKTSWHNLIVWGKQAEIADKYLRKGKQIFAEGRIEYREYEDSNGQRKFATDIRVDKFIMLGGPGGGGGGRDFQSQESGSGREERQPMSYGDMDYEVPESDSFNDDDIPF